MLSLLAGIRGQRTVFWLALVVRLVLFVLVVFALARIYGPAASVAALLGAVVTRGLRARKRLAASR